VGTCSPKGGGKMTESRKLKEAIDTPSCMDIDVRGKEAYEMREKGQVLIKDVGVYLYTHRNADVLILRVQEAMAKEWRWDDPEYLARIIFDCMKGDDTESETDYGIGTERHEDIWTLITVDCKSQIITVEEYGKIAYESTFREFIETDFDPDLETVRRVVDIIIIKP
jgi:hypothetical protein